VIAMFHSVQDFRSIAAGGGLSSVSYFCISSGFTARKPGLFPPIPIAGSPFHALCRSCAEFSVGIGPSIATRAFSSRHESS
jgi:hypothetical protein